MDCDDVLVAFCCLLFTIARSKKTPDIQHDVGGPLLCGWGEECAAKSYCVFELMGEHRQYFRRGGRATSVKSLQLIRDFDSTRGYPGEDIPPPPSL